MIRGNEAPRKDYLLEFVAPKVVEGKLGVVIVQEEVNYWKAGLTTLGLGKNLTLNALKSFM